MTDTIGPTLDEPTAAFVHHASVEPTVGTMVRLSDLRSAPVLIDSGPTGRSAYWEDVFSVLHPDRATTDVAFNLVDEVWTSRAPVFVRIFFSPDVDTDTSPALADVVRQLREQVPLPAADLAAMLGLRRRQFYNLLSGSRASTDRERWIRTLGAAIERLSDSPGADTDRLRAAILQPLSDGHSLYDRACVQDEEGLTRAVARLADAFAAGQISGRLRRPSPRRSGRAGAGSAAADFLSGYRDRDSEPG